MVLTEEQVAEQVRRFVTVVRHRIPVDQVLLFGSYARGAPRPWSDIDVAVISPAWDGYTRQERIVLLARWAWEANAPWVEAVGYTPAELAAAAPGSFVGDIRDHGVPIEVETHERPDVDTGG